jgi:hypothetical protein
MDSSVATFSEPITSRIVDFIRQIGIAVRAGEITGPTPCPGILVEQGVLVVDETRLSFPGDLLHEAGHLAVMPPGQRPLAGRHVEAGGGEEMMAIAWSYAAALHIEIDPAVVFHAGGYRGQGAGLRENFRQGHYLAVPLLEWVGMTWDNKRAAELGVRPYPAMRRWLRETADPGHASALPSAQQPSDRPDKRIEPEQRIG